MNIWEKLIHLKQNEIGRGVLLKFYTQNPTEEIIMMLGTGWSDQYNLVRVTGFKAGARNPFVEFPVDCESENGGVSVKWLIQNWQKWVEPDCKVEDVCVRLDPIRVQELE